jgi:hypothetical protein
MDKATGLALYTTWKKDQNKKQKKALLVEKAKSLRDELVSTCCTQLTIQAPRTANRVLTYDKFYFMHYEDGELTIWNMSENWETGFKRLVVGNVLKQEEMKVEELIPYLLEFVEENSFKKRGDDDSDEEDM